MWLRGLLAEFIGKVTEPTTLHCDNQATVRLGEEGTSHKRMKHILIRLAFLRDMVAKKVVKLRYIPTTQNLADFFTKSLGRLIFVRLRKSNMKGGPVVITGV